MRRREPMGLRLDLSARAAEAVTVCGCGSRIRGGMCCSVSGKGGLLVRVEAGSYEAAVREPHVQPMKMGKRVMSGFVRVAPEGYRTTEELRAWVLRGVAGVVSREAAARRRSRRQARGAA